MVSAPSSGREEWEMVFTVFSRCKKDWIASSGGCGKDMQIALAEAWERPDSKIPGEYVPHFTFSFSSIRRKIEEQAKHRVT